MKIVTDHGFPKVALPTDDAFDAFKNERDYVVQVGKQKTTIAAMNWAVSEMERLRQVMNDALAMLADADLSGEDRAGNAQMCLAVGLNAAYQQQAQPEKSK